MVGRDTVKGFTDLPSFYLAHSGLTPVSKTFCNSAPPLPIALP